MKNKYIVWQHRTGTKPMSLADCRKAAEEMERSCETSRGTIIPEDKVDIMPARILPESPEWFAYLRKLHAAGKRRL